MRILMVHNHYQQPGGEDASFRAEAQMLNENGHDVIRYVVDNAELDSLGKVRAGIQTIWNQNTYRELSSIMAKDKIDVAHFQNTFPRISPSGYYAANGLGVPVVQTLRNYRLVCPTATLYRDGKPCEDCVGRVFPWPGVLHKCYRNSRAASGAVSVMLATHRVVGTWKRAVDRYITLTNFAKEKLVAGGLSPDLITVKPNFVSPDPGAGKGNGGYALFIGRLSEEKGIVTLLKAWRRIGVSIPLQIIGNGPLAHLVAHAASPGSGITWLKWREPAEVQHILKRAQFLVVPSECYETFGRVIIEAYACGTPVIASDIGAFQEILDDGNAGLRFRSGDWKDLVSKVQELARYPHRLSIMRATARSTYLDNFSSDQNYPLLLDAYQQAIRAKASVGR